MKVTLRLRKNLIFLICLNDNVLDEINPFSDQIKIKDIYIEDNLLDDTDSKDIKKVSDGVTEEINFGGNTEIPSDDECGHRWIKKENSQPK